MDTDLVETAREDVLGGLIGTITDLRKKKVTLELSADTGIDTLGHTPSGLNLTPTIGVESGEGVSLLLDNSSLNGGGHHRELP